jgi:hypothetical protein
VLPKDFYLKYRTNNRANFTYSSRFKNVGSNLVINLMKNQMIGSIDPLLLRQPEMLQSMNKHKRILGHLSAVYCVCFDRTGRYILTVTFFKINNFYKYYFYNNKINRVLMII